MTAFRIFRTARPSMVGAPVLPMDEHDRIYSHSRVMAMRSPAASPDVPRVAQQAGAFEAGAGDRNSR